MALTITLSDGTTSVDLYGGSDALLRHAGMDMPPPSVDVARLSNPYYNGDRLVSSRRGNRMLNLTVLIQGTSLSDLRDNIRTLQRLLNDAEQHTLLGYGAQVYLQYQLGNSAGASVYYDILRGDLNLGADYLGRLLEGSYKIASARLTLECKPFGRYTDQDLVQATLENSNQAYQAKDYSDDADTQTYRADNVARRLAQTFAASASYTAVGAAINCYRTGTPGDVTFALYATDGLGHPTGAVLATGTEDGDAWSTLAGDYSGWRRIMFAAGVALASGTKYALVINSSTAAGGSYITWRHDDTGGLANGNVEYSDDSGANWTADANRDFAFHIYAASTDANYQDVTTDATYGDVPALAYIKLDQTGATAADRKIWVAKRSGTRQSDDLWHEAEDASFTADYSGGGTVEGFPLGIYNQSCGLLARVYLNPPAGQVATDTAIGHHTVTISTVPRGKFRVLARVRSGNNVPAGQLGRQGFAFGYTYGDRSFTPSFDAGDYKNCAADSAFEILDLGILALPPVAESAVATNNALSLHLYSGLTEATTGGVGEYARWDWDYVLLLPIDEGYAVIDDVGADDLMALDGIHDPPAVLLIDGTGKITDTPDYQGRPFDLGRESTRIYVLRDDVPAVTFASDIKYRPQFMVS